MRTTAKLALPLLVVSTTAKLALPLLVAACDAPMPAAPGAPPPSPKPASAASAPAHLEAPPASLPLATRQRLDRLVGEALARDHLAGAVVAVVRRRRLAFVGAYGRRAVEPAEEPMTADTRFDLASLTKPITAATILTLVDEGRLGLDDPVSKHLAAFATPDKQAITVEMLLRHTSGLPAANPLGSYRRGREQAIEAIAEAKLVAPPDARTHYSDLGYIVLGELAAHVSGVPFDRLVAERVTSPSGMDASFKPPSAECAPTERLDGSFLRGVVHDPRARALGGASGHAGLFGTASDVARFAIMLSSGGLAGGRRVLSAGSAARLLEVDGDRGLAFEHRDGGAWHTGFTGTSLWIDARSGDAVVLLTSRLHPDGRAEVGRLRLELRRLVAGLPKVRSGIDRLVAEGFASLRGKRVGLVTNRAARDAEGRTTLELFGRAPVELVALFTPEHGLDAKAEGVVSGGKHGAIPAYSLFGKTRRPTAAQLRGIDTLVFDVQDVGARFYTYITTLGYLLEEAAKHGIEVVVLDRPNPLGGRVAGPVLEPARRSFIGYHELPVRHGMTVGELARMFIVERRIATKLRVVALDGWSHELLFDETAWPWRAPSPNLRSFEAALLYPGLGLLEATNLSVGRGTGAPFLKLGAPWLDGAALAMHLRSQPGVRVTATTFTPASSKYAGKPCHGVAFEVTDPHVLRPVALGFEIARFLRRRHPKDWQHAGLLAMLGNEQAYRALLAGKPDEEVVPAAKLAAFAARRRSCLLYP